MYDKQSYKVSSPITKVCPILDQLWSLIFPCFILSTHWCCLWYRPFTKLFLHVFANWIINNIQIKHPSRQWNPYPGISKTIKPPSTSTFRPGTSVFRASSRSSPRAKRCPNCESANSWMAAWVQTWEGVLRIGLNLKQRKCRYMNICKFLYAVCIWFCIYVIYTNNSGDMWFLFGRSSEKKHTNHHKPIKIGNRLLTHKNWFNSNSPGGWQQNLQAKDVTDYFTKHYIPLFTLVHINFNPW